MTETKRYKSKKVEKEEQKTGASGEVGLDTGEGGVEMGKKEEEADVGKMKIRNDGRRKLIEFRGDLSIFLSLLPFSSYRKNNKKIHLLSFFPHGTFDQMY